MEVKLPVLPDDDADFTPDLARKIIAKYQELLAVNNIDRITAERDGLRKALEELDKKLNRMWITNVHQRSEYVSAVANVKVAQDSARTILAALTLAVSDADGGPARG